MTLAPTTFTAQARNAHQWRAIAYFLAGFQTLASSRSAALAGAQAQRAPASAALPSAINFGGCVAPCTTSGPDGNHGDNFAGSRA